MTTQSKLNWMMKEEEKSASALFIIIGLAIFTFVILDAQEMGPPVGVDLFFLRLLAIMIAIILVSFGKKLNSPEHKNIKQHDET